MQDTSKAYAIRNIEPPWRQANPWPKPSEDALFWLAWSRAVIDFACRTDWCWQHTRQFPAQVWCEGSADFFCFFWEKPRPKTKKRTKKRSLKERPNFLPLTLRDIKRTWHYFFDPPPPTPPVEQNFEDEWVR